MGERLAVWAHGTGTDRRTMLNFAWLNRLFRARVHQHPRRQLDHDRNVSQFFGMHSSLLAYPGLL